MKFLILILLPLNSHAFSLNKSEISPKNATVLKRVIEKIKKDDLIEELRSFVQCCGSNRLVGSQSHKKAVDYLKKTIESYDKNKKGVLQLHQFKPDSKFAIDLYQKDFDTQIKNKYSATDPLYKTWNGFTQDMVNAISKRKDTLGTNIIWEKTGTENPDEYIIVGAHFDTIAHDKNSKRLKEKEDMPGADDNGSAVSILLSMIKIIESMEIKRSIRFVLFDYEELGFLGSKAYVDKYHSGNNEKIIGMVNLEMLGHDSKRTDKNKRLGNMKAYIRTPNHAQYKDDSNLAKIIMNIPNRKINTINFELTPNGFNSSDHINFWDKGIAAITFTQNWEEDLNPRYHTKNDFVETINKKTLYNAYRYIALGVISYVLKLER